MSGATKAVTELEYAEEVKADERMKRKARSKKKAVDASAAAKHSKKQPIKRLREKRRRQCAQLAVTVQAEEQKRVKRKVDAGIGDHPGNIVAESADGAEAGGIADFYWEVETVVGRRVRRGRVEYLIRWKGCSEEENTWEPAVNLCDTAMEEAMKFVKRQKLKAKQCEEDEKKLFGDADTIDEKQLTTEKEANKESTETATTTTTAEWTKEKLPMVQEEIIEDNFWDWKDHNQVVFQPVQRINIHDADASLLVKEARINGTPVVLVGHIGWAQFAKRWISNKEDVDSAFGGADAAKVVVHPSKTTENRKGENDMLVEKNTFKRTNPLVEQLNERTGMSISNGSKEASEEHTVSTASATNSGMETNAIEDATTKVNISGEAAPDDSVNHAHVNDVDRNPATTSLDSDKNNNELLDLSKGDYFLDIKKMIDDIGEEDVPVIKRNYNEENPIHGTIHAAKFLTNCWPSEESDAETTKQKTSPNLYLHQWQFPLSDTAGRKLCHQNNPLPKSIMGEDLLKFWLDLPQCKFDSPLQYIFMGREDTLSKLHSDPGGLDISIAPIVGEKECVLGHRADGSSCLYHLQASLNNIDLHQYPLLSQAKLWRTTIKPGEILLMPHGTYHQCRNVTPCLSYSRFHLDTVNLLPFVQSLVNGDAPEIHHEEILWNLTTELISKVDIVFDHTQSLVKQNLSTDDDISEDMIETVNTLRMLRHFAREVARRHEIRERLKGEGSKSDHCFGTLVDDVDMCLHEFRFRKMRTIPPFKARQGKALKNTIAKGGRKDVIATDLSKYEIEGKPVVAFNTIIEVNYMSLKKADVNVLYPNASKKKVGETLMGTLAVGDMVNVKLEQKVVKAEVLEVVSQMHAAYMSFEDYPSLYDEYQPTYLLRTPDRGEIAPNDLKPGLIVLDLSNSNEYRAQVMSIHNGPMARMRLFISQHVVERWISPQMILGKYEPPTKQVKQTKKYRVEVVEEETSALPCRPNSGDVVEVYRRGAAWVTKVHEPKVNEGEKPDEIFPTHVDVRYILGSATEERMVPIGLVRLAPELDPDSERSHRERRSCEKEERN